MTIEEELARAQGLLKVIERERMHLAQECALMMEQRDAARLELEETDHKYHVACMLALGMLVAGVCIGAFIT